MRTLLLLRHAKAVPAEEGQDDHERALAERGHAQAGRMAEHFAAEGFAPTQVLCSTSRRTRETLAHLRPHLPAEAQVELERRLYLATPGTLLTRIHAAPDAARELLLVGHNPGMEDLARGLAGAGKKKALERLASFSTGTLAVLRFEGRWRDLAPGGARLDALVRPKDLD
jgi:phosphohistidine phosphatase